MKLVHQKCHLKSYHDDIKHHMTLNIIFGVHTLHLHAKPTITSINCSWVESCNFDRSALSRWIFTQAKGRVMSHACGVFRKEWVLRKWHEKVVVVPLYQSPFVNQKISISMLVSSVLPLFYPHMSMFGCSMVRRWTKRHFVSCHLSPSLFLSCIKVAMHHSKVRRIPPLDT